MRNLIELALDIIDTNNKYRSNHLSFITRRNTIIAIGRNYEDKSHTIAARWGFIDGKIHSELDAILKASRSDVPINRCSIWNVRIDRYGKAKIAKPCVRCQRLLQFFGLKEIWWTNKEGRFAAE